MCCPTSDAAYTSRGTVYYRIFTLPAVTAASQTISNSLWQSFVSTGRHGTTSCSYGYVIILKSESDRFDPLGWMCGVIAVAYSREVTESLDLDVSQCERPEFALIMSGAAPVPGR